MSTTSLIARATRAYQRRAARWFGRRTFTVHPGRAIVSFTFDDFPRSALLEAGEILQRSNLAATYYASLGLTGHTTASGQIFDLEDLSCLFDLGHELGCHTYDHCPAWETNPLAFEASVVRNAEALHEHFPYASLLSLSYPISYPRPETKERAGRHFLCCRGGGQTFNIGTVDLNYLSAFFLEQSLHRPEVVHQAIADNVATGGWLIFATHDVCASPSPYGCTPTFFREVVQRVIDSGSLVLPVARAWDAVHARVPFRW